MKNIKTSLYLQLLANKHGDFKVSQTFKNTKGELCWTKHHSVLELWEKGTKGIEKLDKINNRQILPNETIFDFDDQPTIEKVNTLCDWLENKNIHYTAYHTGSRGYHVHILSHRPIPQKIKEHFLNKYKCDTMKASPNVLIALEGSPHYKTGNTKKEIRHYGINRIHREE